MAENFKYWLYDKSKVTPWYFGKPKASTSDDRLRDLWLLDEEPVKSTGLLSDIQKANKPWFTDVALKSSEELAKWIWTTFTDFWSDVFEWGKNLVDDIKLLSEWRVDETKGLLWDFLKAWEGRVEKINELNAVIDATGGNMFDKAIWTGLNVLWAGVDFTWDVLVSGLKTLAPEGLERATEEGLQNFLQTDFGKWTVDFIKTGWEKLDQFKETSPEANRLALTIESLLPAAELATGWVTAKFTKEVWEELLEAWVKKSWELIESWKDIIQTWKETIWESVESLKDIWLKAKELIPQTPSKIFWEKPSSFAKNIAWIDEQTKNILKEVTTEDFDRFVQAGKDATTNIKNPTPLEIAWDEASDTLRLITNAKRAAWANKSQILKNIETKTIETQPILDDFTSFIEERFNLKLDNNLKLVEIEGKKANIWDASIADVQGMSDELLDLFTQKEINLWNLDATVDRIQDSLWARVLDRWAWGKASSTEKQISSFLEWKLNQRLKDVAWDEFIDANKEFRRLLDMETRLAKALGKEWERGWSLMKTVFSPQTGQKTKELFRKIEEEFGIDLTTKAWLAKFSMQLSWDPRQANLLEALDLWTWFTSKLQKKFEWTLVSPLIEGTEALLKKWFSPEKVGRWLTK